MKILITAFISVAIAAGSAAAQTPQPNETVWKNLEQLCGKAFAGTVIADTTGDERFKDKAMVMHVRSCQKDRIRIPFVVGDDLSRTWVLTRSKGRILLKHDHRHKDGKPDEVTMYGGWTTSVGMPTRQMFPADEETVKVIAAAATNVWWIDLVPGEYFTYNLRRMGSDRLFSVKFDLTRPIAAPPAPWGWKD